MNEKKKTILAVKCAQCGATYMANDLTYGIDELVGSEIKDAIAKGDEIFLTSCAIMSMCKCEESEQKGGQLNTRKI